MEKYLGAKNCVYCCCNDRGLNPSIWEAKEVGEWVLGNPEKLSKNQMQYESTLLRVNLSNCQG